MKLLEEKVAVVTGGSSGNGRAIALAFARHGAKLVIADITEEPREGGQTTIALVRDEIGGTAEFIRCDVTNPDDLEAAVDRAEALGGIDIMMNNAGILLKGSILDVTPADLTRTIAVNVKGTFYGAQAAARRMVERKSGAIINMASIAALRGTGGYAAYNLSKSAVRMLTSSLADELGPHGIRVNAVCPGIINTEMNIVDDPVIGTEDGESYLPLIPARRWGEASEVADVCVFLASDMASYVYGASIVADGGYIRF